MATPVKQYTTILFDLDHTLWDYEKNSLESLQQLHSKYDLYGYGGITFTSFLSTFQKVNRGLWDSYNMKIIDRAYIKEHRFRRILESFEIDNSSVAQKLSVEYIELCPQKTHLMPYALDALNYLSSKYKLFLLTNGFDDVQTIKLNTSKISNFFDGMVTSETCGHRKPATEIFEYTLEQAQSKAEKAIMIGDNLMADIRGARNASLDTVFYNPLKSRHKEPTTYEIDCLSQLTNIF